MILAWFHNLTLMEMQECAWKTFMWTLIFNTSSVMYFRWVCGWRKQLFWGKKFLSSYFYTCGKTTQVRIWSLCRRIFFFFTGHKFCFSVLSPSKGTICGAPASLSCWFSAGACSASCLVRLGSVRLGWLCPAWLSSFTWSCSCAWVLLLLSSAWACPVRSFVHTE